MKEFPSLSIHFDMARSFQQIRAFCILVSLPALAVFGCSGRIELVDGGGGKDNAGNSRAGDASLAGTSNDSGGGGTSGIATSDNAGAPAAGGSVDTWGAAGSGNHFGGTLSASSQPIVGSSGGITGAGSGTGGASVPIDGSGGIPPRRSTDATSRGGASSMTPNPGLGGAVPASSLVTGGTGPNSQQTTSSGGTINYVTSWITIGGNITSVVTFPAEGGTSAVKTLAGGAPSTASTSPCAGIVCPTLPDLCTSIVQAPGACCPTCTATSCPVCPEVTTCAEGTHAETRAGACCPECVPDACVAAHDNYNKTLQAMVKKYSTGGCKTSPECVVMPEKNACAISCGNVIVANMADSFASSIESMAKSCADCAPPTPPPPCPVIVPACVNGRCIAASPG